MKKLLFVLLIMASVTSFCFAQEEPTGVSKTGKGPAEVQTFIGIIDSVTIGTDPMGGNKSEIVVKDNKGQKVTFVVRSGIGVAIASSDRLESLKDLNKDDLVIIEYIINKDGSKKAITVTLARPKKR